jgi:DMSO/TMAO reductase YedYZ molybdopterin-dependent catalytic subunit
VTANRLPEIEPPARVVDGTILVLVTLEVISGLVSLVAGTPDWWWLFVLHSIGGLTLVVLLFWKLRRVRPRITRRSSWDGATPVSILLAILALAALATGIYWQFGGVVRLGPWTLLTIHMLLGVAVVPVLLWHLRHRFRLPQRREIQNRRTAIQFGALLAGGTVFWRLQDLVAGSSRFTGSKESGTEGNDFSVTSWVADDPDPIDTEEWRLQVGGEVATPRQLAYDELQPSGGSTGERASEQAVLDCTSGWYAERNWEGIRVGDLLEDVEPTESAGWVRFQSVTGYKWSLPIEEARNAVLATHVDGESLSHGHGAPMRLVAPGRRGFQWVKWVIRVDVTQNQDLSQWIAIFVSGFD